MVLCATVGISLIVSGIIAYSVGLVTSMPLSTACCIALLVFIGIGLMDLSYKFYQDIKKYHLIRFYR